MMRVIAGLSLILLTLLLNVAKANEKQTFIQGKDYKLLANTSVTSRKEVKEFFSYGCPACYQVEPGVEEWLAHKPENVAFTRIPVTFHQGWEAYAKAYYIAEAFDIEPKLTPKLFAAIQDQNMNLTTGQALAEFFAKEGIKAQDFQNAYDNSPTIAIKLKQGDAAMKQYGIFEVPTFIINEHYYTTVAMAKDSKRLTQIINFLITKAA